MQKTNHCERLNAIVYHEKKRRSIGLNGGDAGSFARYQHFTGTDVWELILHGNHVLMPGSFAMKVNMKISPITTCIIREIEGSNNDTLTASGIKQISSE